MASRCRSQEDEWQTHSRIRKPWKQKSSGGGSLTHLRNRKKASEIGLHGKVEACRGWGQRETGQVGAEEAVGRGRGKELRPASRRVCFLRYWHVTMCMNWYSSCFVQNRMTKAMGEAERPVRDLTMTCWRAGWRRRGKRWIEYAS